MTSPVIEGFEVGKRVVGTACGIIEGTNVGVDLPCCKVSVHFLLSDQLNRKRLGHEIKELIPLKQGICTFLVFSFHLKLKRM